MCGIAGVIQINGSLNDSLGNKLLKQIINRGPDFNGKWKNDWVELVHARLAIIDATARSNQPFVHGNGSILSFNGEIYNFLELKELLIKSGVEFKTSSDTEVLLHGLVFFGIDFVNKIEGDFAFSFFDSSSNSVYLVRDRFGVKPLYWTKFNSKIIFSSNIKSLLELAPSAEINKDALVEYLQFRYVKNKEATLFKNIYRIKPAHWIKIDQNGDFKEVQYWSLKEPIKSETFNQNHFDELFESSVTRRLIGDFPVINILSGGVDSTAITLASCKNNSFGALTFDTGFNQEDIQAAKQIASELKIDHNILGLESLETHTAKLSLLDLEEPLGDSIIQPTRSLYHQARNKSKVVLSGEGADEIFGTYVHQKALRALNQFSPNKDSFSRGVLRTSSSLVSALAKIFNPYPAVFGSEANERLQMALKENLANAHTTLSSLFLKSEVDQLLTSDYLGAPYQSDASITDFRSLLVHDINHWLPNYGLLRTDKLSMSSALEVRVPYLDHKLVEYCINSGMQLNEQMLTDKSPIRSYIAKNKNLPAALAKRKKFPFFNPTDKTLDKNKTLEIRKKLSKKSLDRFCILNSTEVQKLFDAPTSFVSAKKITSLYHLQLWCELFLDGEWKITK